GEQPHTAYGGEVRWCAAMLHFAFRQCMFDKHGIDGLQKEFSGQIHDRSVFIIKFAVFGRRISIAGDKMIEEVEMSVDMTIYVHRQEAGQLQKAGINSSSDPCIAIGNGADAMAPKPFAATLLGQK